MQVQEVVWGPVLLLGREEDKESFAQRGRVRYQAERLYVYVYVCGDSEATGGFITFFSVPQRLRDYYCSSLGLGSPWSPDDSPVDRSLCSWFFGKIQHTGYGIRISLFFSFLFLAYTSG